MDGKIAQNNHCFEILQILSIQLATKNQKYFVNQRYIENHVTDPNLSAQRRRIIVATNQPTEELSRRDQNTYKQFQNQKHSNFEEARLEQDDVIAMEKENNYSWAMDQSNRRFCTMPDGESIEIQENEEQRFDRTVQACLICFDNEPNAVNLNCGHGGICYACAIEIMQKTGECFLCRSKIVQVLQLDLNSSKQNSNKIEVLQAARMVTSITNNI